MVRRSHRGWAIVAALAVQANVAQANSLCSIVRVEKADFGVRVYFAQGTTLKHGGGMGDFGWRSVIIDANGTLPDEPIKPIRPLQDPSRYKAFAAASGEIFSLVTSRHVGCTMQVLYEDGRLGVFATSIYDGHGLPERVSKQTEFIPAD